MINWSGYELILGSVIDPQFGPVLLFGMGGQLVEVFKDRALGLPPLNTTLARRMMERTKIHQALRGVRGRRPVDLAALEQLLVRFSQLVVEQRWIKEIDINPLLASPERLVALDARVVLHDADVPLEAAAAARDPAVPAPVRSRLDARDGSRFRSGPSAPRTSRSMVRVPRHAVRGDGLLRYFQPCSASPQRTAHERLIRVCFNDYDREIALVAEHGRDDGTREIVGVGRLSKAPRRPAGEFAVLVGDPWQRHGLGGELLRADRRGGAGRRASND